MINILRRIHKWSLAIITFRILSNIILEDDEKFGENISIKS